MNANFWSPRMMFGAAIVGLVGAAGVFIYEQMYAEKRRTMLVREVARLDKQVSSMRTELENLREVQKESQLRKAKQKKKRVHREAGPVEKTPNSTGDMVDGTAAELSYASDSEYFTDYQSVAGTDREMDSDEFYDVHTDEDDDDTLRDSVRNGHLSDHVFDEDPSEKTDSPKKLPQNRTSDVLV